MPSLAKLLFDPILPALLGIFAALSAVERCFLWRALPAVPGWKVRALTAFGARFVLSSYLPLLWAGSLAPLRLFDLSRPSSARA